MILLGDINTQTTSPGSLKFAYSIYHWQLSTFSISALCKPWWVFVFQDKQDGRHWTEQCVCVCVSFFYPQHFCSYFNIWIVFPFVNVENSLQLQKIALWGSLTRGELISQVVFFSEVQVIHYEALFHLCMCFQLLEHNISSCSQKLVGECE